MKFAGGDNTVEAGAGRWVGLQKLGGTTLSTGLVSCECVSNMYACMYVCASE